MRTRIRKEIAGFAQDVAVIATIVFALFGGYYLLKFLFTLVHTIITIVIATSGTVLVAALLIWAVTEMPTKAAKKDKNKIIRTEGS